MPRAQWSLNLQRPMIQIELSLALGGQAVVRQLLADTGAGTASAAFEMLLDEQDCLLCGGIPLQPVMLGGAYSGWFPAYLMQIKIPALAFDRVVPVVGVS